MASHSFEVQSESHVPGAVSESEYPATVAVSDVHVARTRVHIPAHSGFDTHNGPPDSILLHELKPLEKHRPPPLQSVLSPDKLSYPP
ncbi:hypothetical protein Tco_0645371 [Tanacetum coccineum]